MLDDSGSSTLLALSELVDLKAKSSRPIVLWIGAGASRWAGLPSWAELGEIMRSEFLRREPAFDNELALKLCYEMQFPKLFELCKQVSQTRYHSVIVRELSPQGGAHPVYERLLNAIRQCAPCGIVTTNADELLERGLSLPTISPANLERIPSLLRENSGFVAKLHGSISDINSIVFTEDEYSRTTALASFRNAMGLTFQSAHVVFVGYGLADDYVLRLLQETEDLNRLFGAGPHFACLPNQGGSLPSSVKVIRYSPEPHRDHRGVIEVVEELAGVKDVTVAGARREFEEIKSEDLISAHFLADVYPPGVWESSQKCVIASSRNGPSSHVMYAGHGLRNDELPNTVSTALHDIVVGLLCFDKIFASLNTIGRVVHLLGPPLTLKFVSTGVLQFVRSDEIDAVVFSDRELELTGGLGSALLEEDKDGNRITAESIIRRQIRPAIGKHELGERIVTSICEEVGRTVVEDPSLNNSGVPARVRGMLVRPSMRKMLGMSGGTPNSAIPSWLKYPILRLSHVVRLGSVCRALKVVSAKLDYGQDVLATMAFGSAFGSEYAGNIAGYVLAGRFSTDLGAYIHAHPDVIGRVLEFRETSEGATLRRHIRECLCLSEGNEVATAINAALRQTIPLAALEAARIRLAKLHVASGAGGLPALWHDTELAKVALGLWRKRSGAEFVALCKSLKRGPYDQCPCGSGEKIRFCCAEALGVKLT